MNRRSFLKSIAVLTGAVIASPHVPVLVKKAVKKVAPRSFDKWIFPVIKNMNTTWDLKEIMSVQPMSGPCGEVFYLDFKRRRWWHFFNRRGPRRTTVGPD